MNPHERLNEAKQALTALMNENEELKGATRRATAQTMEAILLRRHFLPRLILAARVDVAEAQSAVWAYESEQLAPELETAKATATEIAKELEAVQKRLYAAQGEVRRLDTAIVSMRQERQRIALQVEDLRNQTEQQTRMDTAPVVRALNFA